MTLRPSGSRLAFALQLAGRNERIFALKLWQDPKTGDTCVSPICEYFPYGPSSATSDKAKLRAAFSEYPHALIGHVDGDRMNIYWLDANGWQIFFFKIDEWPPTPEGAAN